MDVGLRTRPPVNRALLARIDAALAQIEPMASQSFAPAQSIRLQLRWCRDVALGISREPMPGALTMGLIAVREFDMYGDRPELSTLINEVQSLMEKELDDARRAGDSRSHRLPGRPGSVGGRKIDMEELLLFVLQLVLSVRMGIALTCAIAVPAVLNDAFDGASAWFAATSIGIGFIVGLCWEFRTRSGVRESS